MLKLSEEQFDIVYSDSDTILVSARAGTGKTTTLLEYVKIRKSFSFLYIVYNNSMRISAMTKFPSFVTVHTIHSLAYEEIGYLYSNNLVSNVKTEDIFSNLDYFKNKNFFDVDTFSELYVIQSILNGYFNSALESIFEMQHEEKFIALANEYWEKMVDKNSKVPMTHDGYLKLFHLSRPTLNFDYILVDEAQDSNNVMLDIVLNQVSAKKIFVGDEHQRIYSFRGAKNIFKDSDIKEFDFFTLTKSFRFGKEIAEVANKFLSFYKQEKYLVKGNQEIDSKVGIIDKSEQYTVITRTNSKLFDLAVSYAREGKKIHIVGGADSIVKSVRDIFCLYKGNRESIESDTIKRFRNYIEFKNMAERIKHPEYVFLVRVMDKYGDSLGESIDQIKRYLTGMKTADIILTTAHKSKGLEFLSVVISDDFIKLIDDHGKILSSEEIDLEEINLLYVAVTRAVYNLELSLQLEQFFESITK